MLHKTIIIISAQNHTFVINLSWIHSLWSTCIVCMCKKAQIRDDKMIDVFLLQLNYVFTVFIPYHACVIGGYVDDSNDNNGDVNIRWYSKSIIKGDVLNPIRKCDVSKSYLINLDISSQRYIF